MTLVRPLGQILVSCQHYLEISPAIGDVWNAYRHWSKGQLQLVYPPGRAPALLLSAIAALDAGYNQGLIDAIDK